MGGVFDCFACSRDPYLSFNWDATFNRDVRICVQSYYILLFDLGQRGGVRRDWEGGKTLVRM